MSTKQDIKSLSQFIYVSGCRKDDGFRLRAVARYELKLESLLSLPQDIQKDDHVILKVIDPP